MTIAIMNLISTVFYIFIHLSYV